MIEKRLSLDGSALTDAEKVGAKELGIMWTIPFGYYTPQQTIPYF